MPTDLQKKPANFREDLPSDSAKIKGQERGRTRISASYRRLLLLTFPGSLILPPLAYFSSPDAASAGFSLAEVFSYLAAYGIAAVLASVGFHLLLKRLDVWLLEESQGQVAFLESISDRFVPVAIVASAGLSLFLELAVIRWQGTIFEFFAFYKNYGLLACFAGLGLGYALCRSENGIPLILTLPLLAWQFGLLIALRWGLPNRPYSLEAIPFREQLNMGLTATWDQIGVVYLLLTVVFLLTALAFVPVGQLCGKLMERKI